MNANASPCSAAKSTAWHHRVKAAIQHEKAKERDKRKDKTKSIHAVSISRLVRVATHQGIGFADQDHAPSQDSSKDTTDPNSSSLCAGEVTWITGFLRFTSSSQDTGDSNAKYALSTPTLCLEDTRLTVRCLCLKPRMYHLNRLVLVKRWRLVCHRHALRKGTQMDVCEPAFAVEIDGNEDSLMPLPTKIPLVELPTAQVMREVIQAHSHSHDPPSFASVESCYDLLFQCPQASQSLPDASSNEYKSKRKAKKRKTYCVMGRIVAISAISWQQNTEDSYFFIEVEHQDRTLNQQNIVVVMMVGYQHLVWHEFLRPGDFVVVLELVKAFSKECNLFLLRTKQDVVKGSETVSRPPRTIYVWSYDALGLNYSPVPMMYDASTFGNLAQAFTEGVISYEGVITQSTWREWIELDRDTNESSGGVVVLLTHFVLPCCYEDLRVGTRIRVFNAHVLHRPASVQNSTGESERDPLILGLCARSMFAITQFSSNAPTFCGRTNSRIHSLTQVLDHSLDKVGLPLVRWLFTLVRTLTEKFFADAAPFYMWSNVKKRHFIRQIAVKCGFDQVVDNWHLNANSRSTLAKLFLMEDHHSNETCSCMMMFHQEQELTSIHVLPLRQLVKHCSSTHEPDSQEVWTPSRNTAIIGNLYGCIANASLEMRDLTGSIAIELQLDSAGSELKSEWLHSCMFMIRRFEIGVQFPIKESQDRCNSNSAIKLPLMRLVCSVNDIECIAVEKRPMNACRSSDRLLVYVTHIDSAKTTSMASSYRHVHGVLLSDPSLPGSDATSQFCLVELVVPLNQNHWYLQENSLYFVYGAVSKPSQDPPELLLQLKASHDPLNSIIEAAAFLETTMQAQAQCWCQLQHSFSQQSTTPIRDKPSKLFGGFQVHQLDSNSVFEPVRLGLDTTAGTDCECSQTYPRDSNGFFEFGSCTKQEECITLDNSLRLASSAYVTCACPVRTLLQYSMLKRFVCKHAKVHRIRSFYQHQLLESKAPIEYKDAAIKLRQQTNRHSPRLYSIYGVVRSVEYRWRKAERTLRRSHRKRTYQEMQKPTVNAHGTTPDAPRQQLVLLCQLRDVETLESVQFDVDIDQFGDKGSFLRPGNVVVLNQLRGFISRSNLKVFLSWGHRTSCRIVIPQRYQRRLVPESDDLIMSAMTTTYLYDMYHTVHMLDKTWHRWLIRVVHVSYVLVKRKCRQCHQALQLCRSSGNWTHSTIEDGFSQWQPTATSSSFTRRCNQVYLEDATLDEATHVSTQVRCIVDDGTAQAELFAENDVAWDLLGASELHKQHYLQQVMRRQVDQLRFFAGHQSLALVSQESPRGTNPSGCSSQGFFRTQPGDSTSTSTYFQNEWSNFIQNCLRHHVCASQWQVFGVRFWKQRPDHKHRSSAGGSEIPAGGSSVLHFSKEVQVSTQTLAPLLLEAQRVDVVNPKHELIRQLATTRRGDQS